MTKGTTTAASRLRAALSDRGIHIKHSVAREIAAAAFGFRSSNAMDEDGIDIPDAEPMGNAGDYHLIAYRDPRSGGLFAIEPSMLPDPSDRKAAGAIVSPYGGLLAVSGKVAKHRPGSQLMIATPDEEEGYLYWSNRNGWVDMASADTFDPDEPMSLPEAGMPRHSVYTIPVASIRGDWTPVDDDRAHDGIVAQLIAKPIVPRDGVAFRHGHPMSRGEGTRFLLLADDRTDPIAYAKYVAGVTPLLEAAGIEPYEGAGRMGLLIPDEYISRAAWAKTWRDAMEDLLTPVADRPRVMAEFIPEAWVRDNAVQADAEGDSSIDVTFEIILMGAEAAREIEDRDYPSDELRDAVRSPSWIRDWGGPFSVEVKDSIAEFLAAAD